MIVKKIYSNSSRLFAVCEIKPGMLAWFYRSSGMNKKAGKTWGGDWFPILGTNSCDSQELQAVRKAVYGVEKSMPHKNDWINKNVSSNEKLSFFTFLQLKETAEELKNSYDKKYWDDFDNEEHSHIYNQYKKELDNLFKIIENKFNTLRKI